MAACYDVVFGGAQPVLRRGRDSSDPSGGLVRSVDACAWVRACMCEYVCICVSRRVYFHRSWELISM